jgi:DNA repair protein RadC|tara:strand:+ start:285 stop:431 length:147 start_codon:yes stop_codon:yes gene_type:complete
VLYLGKTKSGDMTAKVPSAGKSVGVALHDHIIIGQGLNTSFKSMGLLE